VSIFYTAARNNLPKGPVEDLPEQINEGSLRGQRFGTLVALQLSYSPAQPKYLFKCDCGERVIIYYHKVKKDGKNATCKFCRAKERKHPQQIYPKGNL